MANLREFRAMLNEIERKYGSDVEIMPHGPESVSPDNGKRRKWYGPDAPAFYSGFGPQANYIAGETIMGDGSKLKVIMLHGCPLKELNGPIGHPIFTSAIPLFWRPLRPDKTIPTEGGRT